MEIENVKLRWSEYVGELYNDKRLDITDIEIGNNDRPPILKEEVRCATKAMKLGKAVGSEGIAVEVLHNLGDYAVDQLIALF